MFVDPELLKESQDTNQVIDNTPASEPIEDFTSIAFGASPIDSNTTIAEVKEEEPQVEAPQAEVVEMPKPVVQEVPVSNVEEVSNNIQAVDEPTQVLEPVQETPVENAPLETPVNEVTSEQVPNMTNPTEEVNLEDVIPTPIDSNIPLGEVPLDGEAAVMVNDTGVIDNQKSKLPYYLIGIALLIAITYLLWLVLPMLLMN